MNKESIFQLIVSQCRQIIPELNEHQFQWDDSLKNLGANSMDRAEIVMATMDELNIQCPRVEFHGAANLGQLVELFHARQ